MVIDIDGIEKRALQFRIFLMMPFLNELNWLHEEIIAAGADVKARAWRADDIFEAGIIIEQIRDRMFGADAIIAVCTGRNANVFYELGLADQIHKPILVAAKAQDLPFDVTHFRAQLYGPEGSADRDTFRQRLGEDGSFWLFRVGMDGSENEQPTRTIIRRARQRLNHQLDDAPSRELRSR